MKNYKFYVKTSLLALAFIFAALTSSLYAQDNKQVVIYHTNDVHGYVKGDESNVIGIAKAAALKENTENSLLIDAGDSTQGLPIASLTKGSDIIKIMNAAGYDLMTPGNHEFDFGKDNFLSNVKAAEFTVISSNLYEGDKLFLSDIAQGNNGCHKVIEKNGIKIGFFGLTTTQTTTGANPENLKGLEFKDEIQAAKKEIDELEAENADVIIAVCHMGNSDADCTSVDLANAMTGEYHGKLNAIIDGHSHTIENDVENDILIAQTGSGFSGLGKLTVNLDNGNVSVTEELIKAEDVKDVVPKAEVSELIDKINSSQEEILKEVIGTNPTTLWAGNIGDIAVGRIVETNYGDLAADAVRDAAEKFLDSDVPVVGVENGGGIREAVPNGQITSGNLVATFPFSNTLYIKEITPKILYSAMEVSASAMDGQDTQTGMLLQEKSSGGFLQISGFNVVFNPNSTSDKVTSITLDGENTPLDKNDDKTKIMIVGNNFIMSGGNEYIMFGELPKYAEIGGELEIIQNYILDRLNNGVLDNYAGIKNRIIIDGGYVPKDYTVTINIKDEIGNAVTNKNVLYTVDGKGTQNGVTNDNGILNITLGDGPHGVRIGNQPEIYVDNYVGIGITEDKYRVYPNVTYAESNKGDLESNDKSTIKITIGERNISVDDEKFETDSPAYISDSYAMIPLRALYEAISINNANNSIQWDDNLKTVIIKHNGDTIVFKPGSEYVTVNNTSVVMDNNIKAEIKNGRLFIPFRIFAEAIGADVEWDSESKTILYTINA